MLGSQDTGSVGAKRKKRDVSEVENPGIAKRKIPVGGEHRIEKGKRYQVAQIRTLDDEWHNREDDESDEDRHSAALRWAHPSLYHEPSPARPVGRTIMTRIMMPKRTIGVQYRPIK